MILHFTSCTRSKNTVLDFHKLETGKTLKFNFSNFKSRESNPFSILTSPKFKAAKQMYRSFVFINVTLAPVSYTHLDVYKRQLYI